MVAPTTLASACIVLAATFNLHCAGAVPSQTKIGPGHVDNGLCTAQKADHGCCPFCGYEATLSSGNVTCKLAPSGAAGDVAEESEYCNFVAKNHGCCVICGYEYSHDAGECARILDGPLSDVATVQWSENTTVTPLKRSPKDETTWIRLDSFETSGCFANVSGHNWAEFFECDKCTPAFHGHRHVSINVKCSATGDAVEFSECSDRSCEDCKDALLFTPNNNCKQWEDRNEWRTVRWSPTPPETPAPAPDVAEIDLPMFLFNNQCADEPQFSAHNWKVGCAAEIGETGNYIDRQCAYDRRYWFDVRCDDAACTQNCVLKKLYDAQICYEDGSTSYKYECIEAK